MITEIMIVKIGDTKILRNLINLKYPSEIFFNFDF